MVRVSRDLGILWQGGAVCMCSRQYYPGILGYSDKRRCTMHMFTPVLYWRSWDTLTSGGAPCMCSRQYCTGDLGILWQGGAGCMCSHQYCPGMVTVFRDFWPGMEQPIYMYLLKNFYVIWWHHWTSLTIEFLLQIHLDRSTTYAEAIVSLTMTLVIWTERTV